MVLEGEGLGCQSGRQGMGMDEQMGGATPGEGHGRRGGQWRGTGQGGVTEEGGPGRGTGAQVTGTE